MSATVLLRDIVDALEMQLDESSSFLDLDTGRVETVSNDLLGQADESVGEEPDLPAWQKQEWEIANELCPLMGSSSFPPSSTFMSGRSCRTFRIRWRPTEFARIC